MLIVLSDAKTTVADAERYLALRRSVINPAMQEQEGFQGLASLKPRNFDTHVRFALLSWWTGAEEQKRWADTPLHAEILDEMGRFATWDEVFYYEQLDDLSPRVGDPRTATLASIGFHRPLPGRADDYISVRRDLANPSLAKADGFIAATVGRKLGTTDQFMVFFEWADDAKSEEYGASVEHVDVVYPAVADVLTELVPSERYDVVTRLAAELD